MIIIIFQKHYINLPYNKYLYLFIFHILGVILDYEKVLKTKEKSVL